jgi:hypothetical protein
MNNPSTLGTPARGGDREKLAGTLDLLKLAATAICLVAVLAKIISVTQFVFNDGRLVPAFSILHGNPPFDLPGQGLLINSMYGPLSYLYFAPCILLAHNISLALMAGSVLSFTAFVLPVGLIVYRRRADLSNLQMAWLVTLCLLQILFYASFSYSAFNIHADGPAILFSSLCVLALDRREGEAVTPLQNLWFSAALAVMTIWTKQTYAAVVFLPMLVVLLEKHSWRDRILLAGWIGLLNLIFLLVFLLWCGADALWQNLVKIPGSIPTMQASFLYGPDPSAAGGAAGHLRSLVISCHIMAGKYITPYLLLLLAYPVVMLKGNQTTGTGRLSLKLPRLAGFFFLLALFNLPLAADAAIKLSGPSVNDDTAFAWFLLLAVFCLGLELYTRPPSRPAEPLNRVFFAMFMAISLAGLGGAAIHLPRYLHTIAKPFANDEAMVAAACRQSPGKYYFPWNPAAVYSAEGKIYNWEHIAEFSASVAKKQGWEEYKRHLPPQARIIGVPADHAESTTNFLGSYFQNIRPCPGPSVPGSDHFAWFSFERGP